MVQQSLKNEYCNKSIKVMYPDKKIVTAEITGRLSKFAHVAWQDEHGLNVGIEVSWETIIRCKTTNSPINI